MFNLSLSMELCTLRHARQQTCKSFFPAIPTQVIHTQAQHQQQQQQHLSAKEHLGNLFFSNAETQRKEKKAKHCEKQIHFFMIS